MSDDANKEPNDVDETNSIDFLSEKQQPAGERWDPLGEASTDQLYNDTILEKNYNNGIPVQKSNDNIRIRTLEEEQEILTTSLLALTSHFAQVQFRLRQIVASPIDQRDNLLKSLEEFAFRGIPEYNQLYEISGKDNLDISIERQRHRQHELIKQLKGHLEDLESYAYETGEPVLPQSILVEKQKVIIDELRNKINLNLNELDLPQLSPEDLRNHVDTALGEFVSPLKMKEQLVSQLKTQIIDLERFILFLQGETNEISDPTLTPYNCMCDCNNHVISSKKNKSRNNQGSNENNKGDIITKAPTSKLLGSSLSKKNNAEIVDRDAGASSEHAEDSQMNDKTFSLIQKATTLLQMFALAQFGCGFSHFQRNSLKRTTKGNHWGDIRAQLEVDIQEVVNLVSQLNSDGRILNNHDHDGHSNYSCNLNMYKIVNSSNNNSLDVNNQNLVIATTRMVMQRDVENKSIEELRDYNDLNDDDYINDIEDNQMKKQNINRVVYTCNESYNTELITIIRKNFCITLQKLMQHGLKAINDSNSIVPFIGCFINRSLQPHYHENSHTTESCNEIDGDPINQYNVRKDMHAWELILEYYNIKNGEKYNETPARKLSQSFNLDIVGGNAISNKQSLLSTIGTIIAMHSPYKRSFNSHFKAFICAALNENKLVQWLNLIFQCNELVSTYYTSWSYIGHTRFRDGLKSIDRLTKYKFDLPIDLAIRQFQNIKDVFM